jgi:hypothetical protein
VGLASAKGAVGRAVRVKFSTHSELAVGTASPSSRADPSTETHTGRIEGRTRTY